MCRVKVNISEDEIRNYYEQHKNEMVTDATTKIQRFSFTNPDGNKEALQVEAKSALEALRSGKEITTAEFPDLKTEEPMEVSKAELDPRFSGILDATSVGSLPNLWISPQGGSSSKWKIEKNRNPSRWKKHVPKFITFYCKNAPKNIKKVFWKICENKVTL